MLMSSGFTAIKAVHGETMTVTGNGQTFIAVLLVEPSVGMDGELGPDMREQVKLHVASAECPAIEYGATLSDASGNVWRVNRRVNNPADQTVDFDLTAIVTGKDA